MAVKKIPQGYHTVTPFLMVRGAEEMANFLQQAFGATDCQMMRDADGMAMHVDLRIGNSHVMFGEAPQGEQPVPGSLYLYVDDADAMFKRAVDAGGVSFMEPADQFWGDRVGAVRDRFGNRWWIATHVADVSEQEMKRAMQAASHRGEGAPA